ncbi:MAG: peptidoglycan editing factor PgeF [Spirochaetales bacterium]|nr:peptidoglycan editing factor PgeF [Spirochaetales bacterium]
MENYHHLIIQPESCSLEIPLTGKEKSLLFPVKAYLSLKPAGDMAFFKRELLSSREKFLNRFAIDTSKVYSLYQEHTRRVVKVEKRKKPEFYHSITGDGLVTAEKDIFLSVTVADCLPVFIVDKKTGVYGLVHSGWKGTGITLEAVKCMEKEYGSKREHIRVVIGPGIGPCCYQVEEKRYRRFLSRFGPESCGKVKGNYFIDLKKANLILLKEKGITDIDIIKNCTSCDHAFHSFRRDGKERFGVMMAITGYFP